MYNFPYQEERPKHRGLRIAPERMAEILRDTHWGVLATVDAAGKPYAVPIGFAWDERDNSIILHTNRYGQKLQHIARDPSVCFTVVGSSELVAEKFSAGFESLVIFGRMEEITDPAQRLAAATLFCRKFAPRTVANIDTEHAESEINDLAQMMEHALDYMGMYRIVPEHIDGKQRRKPGQSPPGA